MSSVDLWKICIFFLRAVLHREGSLRSWALTEALKGSDSGRKRKEKMADGKKHFQHVYLLLGKRVETGSSRIYGKNGHFDSSFIYISLFCLRGFYRGKETDTLERKSQLTQLKELKLTSKQITIIVSKYRKSIKILITCLFFLKNKHVKLLLLVILYTYTLL